MNKKSFLVSFRFKKYKFLPSNRFAGVQDSERVPLHRLTAVVCINAQNRSLHPGILQCLSIDVGSTRNKQRHMYLFSFSLSLLRAL